MKKIEIPNSLKELSEIFKQNGKKLYIVGGYIRNALLGFCETEENAFLCPGLSW